MLNSRTDASCRIRHPTTDVSYPVTESCLPAVGRL